jgi:hypothetical protein
MTEMSVVVLVFHVGFGGHLLVVHNFESSLVETCEKSSRSQCM